MLEPNHTPPLESHPEPIGPVAWTLVAAILALPWAVALFWPTRDAYTDLRWPASALAVAAVFIAAHFERKRSAPGGMGESIISRFRPLHLSAALIWVGLALSTIFSPAPGLSLRVALRESLWVALALRVATLPFPRRAVSLILKTYLASAAAQAAFAFAQRANPALVAGLTGRAAMLGSLGNPEYMAGYIAPALAAAVLAVTESERGVLPINWLKRHVFYLIVIALTGAGVILSGGRGAALGALIALGAMFVSRRRQTRMEPKESAPHRVPRVIWALAIAGASLMILLMLMGGETRRQSLAGRAVEILNPHSPSTRHRLGLWSITSSMVARDPILGCGPGLFGAAFDRERGRMARDAGDVGAWAFNEFLNDQTAGEAHNDPLQWWAEYGLLPMLGLALVMGTSITAALRRRPARPEDLMLAAALIALVVESFFAFPLHRPARAFILWTLAGLAQARSSASGT